MTESAVAVQTERLLLRQWRDDDLEPFAALNADHEGCGTSRTPSGGRPAT